MGQSSWTYGRSPLTNSPALLRAAVRSGRVEIGRWGMHCAHAALFTRLRCALWIAHGNVWHRTVLHI